MSGSGSQRRVNTGTFPAAASDFSGAEEEAVDQRTMFMPFFFVVVAPSPCSPPPTRHTLSLCLMSPPSYFDREQTEFVEAVKQGEWLHSLLLDESGRKRLVCGVPRQYLSPYLGLKSESQDRLMDLRRRPPPPPPSDSIT